ncbi:MAG: hypothetical protein RLN62_05665 [Rickettsiales bacterium]
MLGRALKRAAGGGSTWRALATSTVAKKCACEEKGGILNSRTVDLCNDGLIAFDIHSGSFIFNKEHPNVIEFSNGGFIISFHEDPTSIFEKIGLLNSCCAENNVELSASLDPLEILASLQGSNPDFFS